MELRARQLWKASKTSPILEGVSMLLLECPRSCYAWNNISLEVAVLNDGGDWCSRREGEFQSGALPKKRPPCRPVDEWARLVAWRCLSARVISSPALSVAVPSAEGFCSVIGGLKTLVHHNSPVHAFPSFLASASRLDGNPQFCSSPIPWLSCG